jgi:glycosyltransferase involved in cell wall biosynthesis
MANPLVSIIVPTRNSAEFLGACLKSIQNQTYKNIEIIVVDRDSTDGTKEIASRFTSHVLNYGPERSAQRNFGVVNATGEYVAIIDSDMELTPKVIEVCVSKMTKDLTVKGVIIPEESFGVGFWSDCKALERSFYVGNDDIEAARFFMRATYNQVGGFDESLVAGEDWDLSDRVKAIGHLARVDEFIRHNEGRILFMDSVKKKYYYTKYARAYIQKSAASTRHAGPIHRYKLFLSRPAHLFRIPLLGLGVLIFKTAEYAAGALAYTTTGR